MTTTTPTTGVTFAQAAAMLAAHLADHTLPEPASLRVNTTGVHSEVMAQLRSITVPTVVTDLLAWADTLTTVTAQAWRGPGGGGGEISVGPTPTPPARRPRRGGVGGAGG